MGGKWGNGAFGERKSLGEEYGGIHTVLAKNFSLADLIHEIGFFIINGRGEAFFSGSSYRQFDRLSLYLAVCFRLFFCGAGYFAGFSLQGFAEFGVGLSFMIKVDCVCCRRSPWVRLFFFRYKYGSWGWRGGCRVRGLTGFSWRCCPLVGEGRRGEVRGRVTKKAGYDGGEGGNGDSRDSEMGGHVEINCWISAMYLLLIFFLRGLRMMEVSI